MENFISSIGISGVVSLSIMIVTSLWLIITSKESEIVIFSGICCNLLPVFVGGLIDSIIGKFVPTYTEMVVMLIGVIIVNVLLVVVFWPWRSSGEFFNF